MQKFSSFVHKYVQILRSSQGLSFETTIERIQAKQLGVRTFSTEKNNRSIVSHKCAVEEYNINYEKTGDGKHTVLLMPGAIGSARTDFTPQLEHMNKDAFTVIGWDPPGYGGSRPPRRTWPEHFFERDADVAAKLMKKLNFTQFSLLGWSDGGITAMILAAKYPELVTKLVIWGANSHVTKEETEMYDTISDISSWSPRMRAPFIELYGEQLFQELWIEWIEAVKHYFNSDRKGDFCDNTLCDIKCPTLIINGEKDAMLPQFHVHNINEKIKDTKLINYPDGKHNLHFKYYKEFNSQVESFLLDSKE